MISIRRVITPAIVAVAVLIASLVFSFGPAVAAPYPPVPPTGGPRVPAVATVPAPAVVAPVEIAPGSFPVQARTGAGTPRSTSSPLLPVAGVGVVAVVVLMGTAVVITRSRTRVTPN